MAVHIYEGVSQSSLLHYTRSIHPTFAGTVSSLYLQVESGKMYANGVPVSTDTLTAVSAYVQQDDLFIGTLTVKEHLIFQA